MATLNSPMTHADASAQLGKAFEFLDEAVRIEMAESFDPLAVGAGLVELFGDVAGKESDTLRVRRVGGLGFAKLMSDMATETQAIVATGITAAYNEVSIGRVGIATEETFLRAITQGDGVDLQMLASQFANSWIKTFRRKWCIAGSGFSTSKGTSGQALDLDDWAGLIAAFEETEGFEGTVVSCLHPEQFSDLRASCRLENGYKFPEPLERFQTLQQTAGYKTRLWGIDVFTSHDVQQSGSDHVGFAYKAGAIGYAVGSTDRIPVPAGYQPVRIAERGMLIAFDSAIRQATNAAVANAFFGLAAVDTSLAPAFKVLSVDN